MSEADALIKRYYPSYFKYNIEKRYILSPKGKGRYEYIRYAPCGAAYDRDRFIIYHNINTNHVVTLKYLPSTKEINCEFVPKFNRTMAQNRIEDFLRIKIKEKKLLWYYSVPMNQYELMRGQYCLIVEDALGAQRLVYRYKYFLNKDNAYKTSEEYFAEHSKNDLLDSNVTQIDIDAINGDVLFADMRTKIDLDNWCLRPRVIIDNKHIYMSYLPKIINREPYIRLDYLWGNPLWNGKIITGIDGATTIQYYDVSLVINKQEVKVLRKDAEVYKGKVIDLPDGGLYLHYSVIPFLAGDTVKWDPVYQVLTVDTAPLNRPYRN